MRQLIHFHERSLAVIGLANYKTDTSTGLRMLGGRIKGIQGTGTPVQAQYVCRAQGVLEYESCDGWL